MAQDTHKPMLCACGRPLSMAEKKIRVCFKCALVEAFNMWTDELWA